MNNFLTIIQLVAQSYQTLKQAGVIDEIEKDVPQALSTIKSGISMIANGVTALKPHHVISATKALSQPSPAAAALPKT
jgi:hypothetical protein